ncbi:RtcB family protein [Listeria swaminathanii]|uniref:3'-phosphate/5'-hydroxy nucleic acid ligase n=1 Tax=Listeria swaminathanii TaxID=2713501 RepID=A0ABU2IFL0_9LIST|nr:RtcB family protein [Listeria swaminathanii]MDT0015591.1 RtcB family protein [Listeria swaminathanii]MDT0021028.1 RtcB family protein [Listeria swaminathanii]MDT0031991.1 RtcB family protein [Listeria swaminathanii]MDT0052159.1 RtcB family protein [Listeria swaminathanii]MDT0054924.1 RtcB family protein [Listeria swaminathanii]
MLTLKGKYNEAKVFTDNVDDNTIGQIITLCNQSFTKDSKIRIMPDTHGGKGCVIGTTMTIEDKIVPNLVGVDIGCGLYVVKLKPSKLKMDFDKLDKVIRERVPSGSRTHDRPVDDFNLDGVIAPINYGWAARSVGTLGGGNHFIEVNQGVDGIYLVIHSGSRVLGKEIAEYHQEVAYKKLDILRKELKIGATDAKKMGDLEMAAQLNDERELVKLDYDLSYLTGLDLKQYLNDMEIAQKFAARNRYVMAQIILKAMKWDKAVVSAFDCVHNYIDIDNLMLRKGATSAQLGEQIIVPLNMRDGSILATGKGNADWNYSAPHGAGRMLSRSKAKVQISLESYQAAMKDVWTTSVSKKTIDEAPKAYKSAKQLLADVGDTMEIQEIIKPLYNFKA